MGLVFTGMQPSGVMQLGNYLGMVKPLLNLQNSNQHKILCSIVDLHSITLWQDPKELTQNSINLAASLIASGIDPEHNILFLQSQVKEHAELAWLLGSVARIGWLNRMIQFKEKSGKNKENASAGLYFYPVLMAADILLYNADLVPVGEDQKQHLEFTRDIANKFNNDYNTDFFTPPEPLILDGARIMSLRDGTKKMSKSDPSDYAKILITDSEDEIISKIMKAKTDSLPMPNANEQLKDRPEIYNLFNIYALINSMQLMEVIKKFQDDNFVNFKQELAQSLVKLINPVRIRYNELLKDFQYLNEMLQANKEKAREIAAANIIKVKKIMGFLE
ncbi:tryptophan--tRNA ligase [Rickettsiales bacterium LUAb2]